MPDVLRIIDANANRAREAIRVMEDAARFLLNDAELCAELKRLRHDLAAALPTMPGLEIHRDTPGDVGTAITTESETTRADAASVTTAAGKRLTEALRAIEEFSKLAPQTTAARFESLRYRAYELERRVHLAMRHTRPRQWKLCLLLTESLCRPHPWEHVLGEALEAGLDCVQVREKHLDAGPLIDHTKRVIDLVAGRATVIVNDRSDIAMSTGAHGVHLGQSDLPPDQARRMFGRQLIIGLSTSRLDQADRGFACGADYFGLGPMFPTTTVGNKSRIAGPAYAQAFLAAHPDTPHLAIGGITPDNAAQVAAAGARGLAVCGAICAAEKPGQVTARLIACVTGSTSNAAQHDSQEP